MKKIALRTITVFSLFLLVLPGCAPVRFSPGGNEASPVVQKLAQSTRSWDGALLPAYPQGQPEVTMLRITVPAGARLAVHRHPVINAGLLLSGHLTVIKEDGKTLDLEAGDPIVEVVNTPHYGINPGKVPAEIVVFYAGITGSPITVKAGTD